MIYSDFHTHSSFSSDSSEPLVQMVRSAYEKGLRIICLTEHMDYDYPGGEFLLDTAAYRGELMRVTSASLNPADLTESYPRLMPSISLFSKLMRMETTSWSNRR